VAAYLENAFNIGVATLLDFDCNAFEIGAAAASENAFDIGAAADQKLIGLPLK